MWIFIPAVHNHISAVAILDSPFIYRSFSYEMSESSFLFLETFTINQENVCLNERSEVIFVSIVTPIRGSRNSIRKRTLPRRRNQLTFCCIFDIICTILGAILGDFIRKEKYKGQAGGVKCNAIFRPSAGQITSDVRSLVNRLSDIGSSKTHNGHKDTKFTIRKLYTEILKAELALMGSFLQNKFNTARKSWIPRLKPNTNNKPRTSFVLIVSTLEYLAIKFL